MEHDDNHILAIKLRKKDCPDGFKKNGKINGVTLDINLKVMFIDPPFA